MEITQLDQGQVADDVVMRERWELNGRSQRQGRTQMPFWSLQDYVGAMRNADSGERQILLAAHEEGRLVGTAGLWFPLMDNTEKAWFEVDVDPDSRRRGVGRALVEHVEALVRAEGRTLMLADCQVPVEGRGEHGHALFARACGFELANDEVVRFLDLPLPDGQIQAWLDLAAQRHQGYTIETFVDGVPEDLVDSLCVLLGQLAVDAPSGSIDFEEEKVTRQRYDDLLATTKAMGRARFEAVALTADREVAAQSTLAVPTGEGTEIYQWGTFVHREHRGHRLGLAVKAANLRAAQAACPAATLVTTQNAETNAFMIAINEQIGFRPVEVCAEYVKRW